MTGESIEDHEAWMRTAAVRQFTTRSSHAWGAARSQDFTVPDGTRIIAAMSAIGKSARYCRTMAWRCRSGRRLVGEGDPIRVRWFDGRYRRRNAAATPERRTLLVARFHATRRTQATGSSYAEISRHRAKARQKASCTTSCASCRSPKYAYAAS
jgi:hypothetical protein